MANQKISDMPNVASANSDDLLYLVQGGLSRNITVGQLFAASPDVLLTGSLQLANQEVVIENGGSIPDTHTSVALAVDDGIDREFDLSSASATTYIPEFVFKVVYLKTTAGGKAIIKGGFVNAATEVHLSDTGQSAVFYSTPNGWIVLTTTGTIV